MTTAIGIFGFSAGFAAGLFIRGLLFENQGWVVLKWNNSALGWQPVGLGTRLFKNDRVTMSLEIDTSQFPDDGVSVE